ncbi:hypothetical protein GCM10025876_10640 [Demequina litorisediminis]|uniref:Succinate dehydrogenase flavoprotein subunit n=1 Tax=Demequina litorisediminis TaxID=1849022 RepID=A0ABQ6IBY4_9MICO|nr:hypothetical protein GCM10025876_10640 [Demequina litorisediminis]
MPVFPTAHYAMGGIPTNVQGEVLRDNTHIIKGLYAAGECACVSVHGANRLGTNSLLDINVFGRRAGIAAAEYANGLAEAPALPADASARLEETVASLRSTVGSDKTERVAQLRKELQETMDRNVQVFRTAESLAEAHAVVKDLQERYQSIAIHDRGTRFNTDLLEAIEPGLPAGACPRWSSRAPSPARSRVAATTVRTSRRVTTRTSCSTPWPTSAPTAPSSLDWKPVVVTKYQPMERKY